VKMKMLLGLLIFLLSHSSYSTEISDPFINPLKELSSEKEKTLNKKGEDLEDYLNLYTPVIDKSFDRLNMEGIIGIADNNYLVVRDPETGKIYMLSSGEAISPDTKIEKISHDEVILVKYHKEGERLKRKIIRLKVGKEE